MDLKGPPLTDLPIIDSTGTIYVLGYEPALGRNRFRHSREKWRGTANGRALYSQIKLYRRTLT